ncbi:unnamed protein product [Caenorhabditis angaria]|uniref:Glucosylceramidase n=1 Tax=Caenorhabditis angaria TaxID=860376 RepID=A0A9P1N5Y8_9PELO|nr:unnamed protein product [Caenorhabditis angaria]
MNLLLFIVFVVISSEAFSPCSKKEEKYGIVCVCNSTYCDTIEPLGTLQSGIAVVYTTSKKGKRLDRSELKAKKSGSAKIQFVVNATQKYQNIMGFGAAFTDASGINLLKLPQNMQDRIITQYFSETDGLGYVFGRVPMASTDFSTHEYSYNDLDLDFLLQNFSLAAEDFNYKIPFIKKAQQASNNNLKLFATPWSPPAWMKTNGRMVGAGKLLGDPNGKYYQTWAQYFVRFFEEYHKQGIDFWSLTPQNEPTTGLDPAWAWQTCYFSSEMERNFIKKLLGPALAANDVTKNLKMMINDDQRINLPHWADVILSDPMAAQYVSGIAIHWYEDFIDPAKALTETHLKHPDYFMLATEACAGYFPATGPELGKWSRAEQYANDLISDIGHFVNGWVDWNYALDLEGGPNLAKNFVDSTIVVNATAVEYYKQPMWHVMGQFSRFIRPGSTRIDIEIVGKTSEVEGLAILNQDGSRTVVILNKSELLSHSISISDPLSTSSQSGIYEFTIEANSVVTIIYT